MTFEQWVMSCIGLTSVGPVSVAVMCVGLTTVGLAIINRLSSRSMAMVQKNLADSGSLAISLNYGINSFSTFVYMSTGLMDDQDDIDYIKNVLKPATDHMKGYFDQMMKCGNALLLKVNNDLEQSTFDVEQTSRDIKHIDSELASLSQELKGKEKDVSEAQKQCDKKQTNLKQAKIALSEAREKLDQAETAQVATEAAGYTTAAVCAVASFVFPPALLGVAAGAATGVVGSTALREAKKDCENIVDSTRREVSSSEKDLENAKQNKQSTEQKLSELSIKKNQTKNKLSRKQKVLQELKTFQKDIITMNENIKKLYRNLSTLHGHFNVLHHETRGGYSISLLRNPTLTVCGSLSTLLNCHGLQSLCDPSKLTEMNQQLHQIQSVEWPMSIEYQDECDDLSLI